MKQLGLGGCLILIVSFVIVMATLKPLVNILGDGAYPVVIIPTFFLASFISKIFSPGDGEKNISRSNSLDKTNNNNQEDDDDNFDSDFSDDDIEA